VVPLTEYRGSLLRFADLFEKLAGVAIVLQEAAALAKDAGKVPPRRKELLSLDELDCLLAGRADFPHKRRLKRVADRLRQLDVRSLKRAYWKDVYGIYDAIPHPVDPRARGATDALFRRFHADLAVPHEPAALETALRATGKAYLLADLGRPGGERGWRLNGWSVPDEYEGETWRASFEKPGVLARDDFVDKGYRWLVLRVTEGPKDHRKTIAVNGRTVGEFVRTGPPRKVRREWWVTRSFRIPQGLLKDGRVEIRFEKPGIAIAGVALAVEAPPNSP
jgi:hypothetical protein